MANHSLWSGRVPSLLRCSHEHLADASGTALRRLVIVFVIFLRLIDPLHSLSWFSSLLLYLLNIFVHYETDIGRFSLCCRSAEL